MEPGTISAIAALVVAMVALLIAAAQVAQQYAATADLMRKCDSIVYGRLPGQGRRVWVTRQLRFKVVYSIPQISLRADLWPSSAPFTPSYAQGQRLPRSKVHKIGPSPGEASWVSFYYATEHSCFKAVRYELVQGDADRCPSDFPVIPMPVSLRDIIVMAIMCGMKIVSVDAGGGDSGRVSISMRGRAGVITSASHPILGAIIHFTPGLSRSPFGLNHDGDISDQWISRLWGTCPVNTSSLDARERAYIEGMESRAVSDFYTSRSSDMSMAEEENLFEPESTSNVEVLPVTPLKRGIHDGLWEFSINSRDREAAERNTNIELEDYTTMLSSRIRSPSSSSHDTKDEAVHSHSGAAVQDHLSQTTNGGVNNEVNEEQNEVQNNEHDEDTNASLYDDQDKGMGKDKNALLNSAAEEIAGPSNDPAHNPPDKQAPAVEKSPPKDLALYHGPWTTDSNPFTTLASETPSRLAALALSSSAGSLLPLIDRCAEHVTIITARRDEPFYEALVTQGPNIHTGTDLALFEETEYEDENRDTAEESSLSLDLAPPINGSRVEFPGQALMTSSMPASEGSQQVQSESSTCIDAESFQVLANAKQVEVPEILVQSNVQAHGKIAPGPEVEISIEDIFSVDPKASAVQKPKVDGKSVMAETFPKTGSKCGEFDFPEGDLEKNDQIYFKDCVSLLYSFPFERVKTWENMEFLIKAASKKLQPPLGPAVLAGRYDLRTSDGHIILPELWDDLVEPGMKITQRAWPLPPRRCSRQPPPPPPPRWIGGPPIHFGQGAPPVINDHPRIPQLPVIVDISNREANDHASGSSKPLESPNPSLKILEKSSSAEYSKETKYVTCEVVSESQIPERSPLQEDSPIRIERVSLGRHRKKGPNAQNFVGMSYEPGKKMKGRRIGDRIIRETTAINETASANGVENVLPAEVPEAAPSLATSNKVVIPSESSETTSRKSSHIEESDISETESSAALAEDPLDTAISWFWISQMNIVPGYWATSWASQFSTGTWHQRQEKQEESTFTQSVCIGVLLVMLQAIDQFTDKTSLQYLSEPKAKNLQWIKENKVTWPPYARNAQNGIVVEALYDTVEYSTANSRLFRHRLPPIELLHSYDDQVNRHPDDNDETIIKKQAELVGLDSWLSLAGRTPEILTGERDLIRITPVLVSRLILAGEADFKALNRTAHEGGFQEIQELADSIVRVLRNNEFSKPEILFFIVAIIRTVKVALCIALGPSTAGVQDILRSDMPVNLV